MYVYSAMAFGLELLIIISSIIISEYKYFMQIVSFMWNNLQSSCLVLCALEIAVEKKERTKRRGEDKGNSNN